MLIRKGVNVFHASQVVVHAVPVSVTSVPQGGHSTKKVAVCQKTVIVVEQVCISVLFLLSTCDLFPYISFPEFCSLSYFAAEFFALALGTCQPCDNSCEACGGSGPDACLSCVSPLVLSGGRCLGDCPKGSYLEQGRCVPCLHTCTVCESRLNCTSCVPGLHLQNGECRSACAAGYVLEIF